MAESITLSKEELQSLLSGIVTQTNAALVEAVRELRKPSLEEQVKIDKERELEQRRMKESVELARVEEEGRTRRQGSCPHRKENNEHTLRGQIHADGMVHLFCLRCQLPFKPFAPTPEMQRGGVNFGNYRLEPAQLVQMTKEALEYIRA